MVRDIYFLPCGDDLVQTLGVGSVCSNRRLKGTAERTKSGNNPQKTLHNPKKDNSSLWGVYGLASLMASGVSVNATLEHHLPQSICCGPENEALLKVQGESGIPKKMKNVFHIDEVLLQGPGA